MEKVSVIIPTKNRINELRICLQSIYAQDYRIYEVIVIDDASTDGTFAMLRSTFPHVILLTNPSGITPCKARNFGMAKSQGSYLWFLDSDSKVSGRKCLSFMIDVIKKNPKVGSIGGTVYVYPDGSESMIIPQLNQFSLKRNWDNKQFEYIECDYVSTSNMLIRKETLQNLGGFDEIYGYMMEDNDIGIKLNKKGLLNVIDRRCIVKHPFKTVHENLYKSFLFYRNTFIFIYQHYSSFAWITKIGHKVQLGNLRNKQNTKYSNYQKKLYSKYFIVLAVLTGFVTSVPLFLFSKINRKLK